MSIEQYKCEAHTTGMLNQIRNLMNHLRRLAPAHRDNSQAIPDQWRADPLSHPALQAMSLDQLADLPFDPMRISEEPMPAPARQTVPVRRGGAAPSLGGCAS